jgi:hypothetical protein
MGMMDYDSLAPRVKGNINLQTRPVVRNGNGFSTVRSMSFGDDSGEVLIPTVSDSGTLLSPQEAISLYRKTGRHLGMFDTPEHATAYAKRLHEEQSQLPALLDSLRALRLRGGR